MIIVNGFQPLTIITKYSILDVAAVLDLPLGALVVNGFIVLVKVLIENFLNIVTMVYLRTNIIHSYRLLDDW